MSLLECSLVPQLWQFWFLENVSNYLILQLCSLIPPGTHQYILLPLFSIKIRRPAKESIASFFQTLFLSSSGIA